MSAQSFDKHPTLKPCPFCGNTPDVNDLRTFRLVDGQKYGAVQCCIIGPEVRTDYQPVDHWKTDAIIAWNDRYAPSAVSPRAMGVSRMFDNDRAVLVSFERRPTDDELRALHDLLAGRTASSVAPTDGWNESKAAAMGKGDVLCALIDIGTDKPPRYEVGWCDTMHGNWHFSNPNESWFVRAWREIPEYER